MKVNGTYEIVSIADEIMAVPIEESSEGQHCVIRLNQTSLEIFELLRNETTAEKIVENLASKYENEKNEIIAFVNETLQLFSECGILQE